MGFDIERMWRPEPDEAESWQRTAQEYGLAEGIIEHITAVTLRPRRVEISPFLGEAVPWELGWKTIDSNDEKVKSLIQKYPMGVHLCGGDVQTRVLKGNDGSIHAECSTNQTQAGLVDEFQKTGFRLPTSDEWEYICGCGEQTLFRWGDHVPCDRYPTDISPEEAEFRKKWVRSRGTLARPAEGFVRDWDLHVRPNGLGISIASNPYHCELVSETGITRGGDGGCSICGGYGFFAGWLPLATAYFEEQFCKFDPVKPVPAGYTVGRRVFELC